MRCIMADIDQRYSCVNARVVLLVKMQLALCPFFVDRPKMLCIRAGMAQKNSYAAIQRPLCLDQVVHTPVCATTDAYGSDVRKLKVPHLQYI